MEPSQPQITKEQLDQINKILDHPTSTAILERKSHTGWTIFWLIAFTPVGWYFVIRKTAWPIWVKVVVIILSAAVLLGLVIESELIVNQIVTSFGGADSNLPSITF